MKEKLNALHEPTVLCKPLDAPSRSLPTRAGTIRRLSPTIVADYFRFFESIPSHEESILVATVNMGNKQGPADYGLGTIGMCLGPPPAGGPPSDQKENKSPS